MRRNRTRQNAFRLGIGWVAFLFVAFSGFPGPGRAEPPTTEPPKANIFESQEVTPRGGLFRELTQKLSPAVVNIRSFQKIPRLYGDFHFGMPGVPPPTLSNILEQQGEGSGFIIDKTGYIVTTTHVVASSDQVQVSLYNGAMFKGRLVGMDQVTDIALVKIDAPFDLPALPLGSSKQMQPGDWVMAIGSPFGLELTVTVGIISAKGRSLGTSPFVDFIQTDASINPGNSGGPLINTHGEAIGMNARIMAQGQGLGFAIPIDLIKKLIPQLKARGRIIRSWMGVVVRDITLAAKEILNLKVNRGSLVMNVLRNSPADKAGIQPNDVILEFAGHPIKNSHGFPRRVAHSPAGEKIPVKIFRGNEVLTLTVILEEVPEEGLP